MPSPESQQSFKPTLRNTLVALAVTALTAFALTKGYSAAMDAGLIVGDGQTHHYDGGVPRAIFGGQFSHIPIVGARAGNAIDDVIQESGIDQKTVIDLEGCRFSFYHDSSYTPLSRDELKLVTDYIIGDEGDFFSNYRLPVSEDMFIFRAPIPQDKPEDINYYLQYQTYTVSSGADRLASHVNLEVFNGEETSDIFPTKVQEDFLVLTELIQSLDKSVSYSNGFNPFLIPAPSDEHKLFVENANNSRGMLLASVRNKLSFEEYEELMRYISTDSNFTYALLKNAAVNLKTYSRKEYDDLLAIYPR